MYAEEIHPQEKERFRFSNHPWISLVALNVTGILMIVLVAIAANLVGVPEDAPYRPLITPTLAHLLVLFVIGTVCVPIAQWQNILSEVPR